MKNGLISAVLLLLSSMVLAQAEKSKTKYFYAVGWEYLPTPNQSLTNLQPVVSNIVSIRCKEDYLPMEKGITNELDAYYTAYYSKYRGFNGLNRKIAFGPYDTWDEAEKDRRKRIADYNQQWTPLLLKDFTFGCDS